MASVYELAKELGEALKTTPQVEALMAAKDAYEADPEIGAKIEEYSKLHQEFEAKMQAGEIEASAQMDFQMDMAKRAEEIRNNKVAAELFAAETNFNNFMNSVFTAVTATMQGEEPQPEGGCSPSACASCGGGCGC